VTDASLAIGPAGAEASVPVLEGSARVEAVFVENYDFVWRLLRRFGVPASEVDDAAQQVFMTFVRKIAAVEHGKERTFLYGTALKVAANSRRSASSRAKSIPPPPESSDTSTLPDSLTEAARLRDLLDEILAQLSDDLRRVLVLAEIEQYRVEEIATLEGIPTGTAASRLRRARQQFRELLTRYGHRNPFGAPES
jgi:RNA polymerase sigma-70 factor (ECF subfamily)